MQDEFPEELRDFISRHIGSVAHLEVLLLLHRSPERSWSASAISQEFRSTESAISHWLTRLVAAQLVTSTSDGFCFQPNSAELRRQTELLAAAYRDRPVKVIELIYARPNPQLLDFFEAFKFRKRP